MSETTPEAPAEVTVTLAHHINLGGRDYVPGDDYTCSPADARSLIGAGYARDDRGELGLDDAELARMTGSPRVVVPPPDALTPEPAPQTTDTASYGAPYLAGPDGAPVTPEP